jgi:hypothetical protein
LLQVHGCGKSVGGIARMSRNVLKDEKKLKMSGPTEVMVKMISRM